MDFTHNKKRNTLFLYEALIRHLTKCISEGKTDKKDKILEILKNFFAKNKPLHGEIELYKILSETNGLKETVAKRLLERVMRTYNNFDRGEIYDEQSKLIAKVSKDVGKEVFSTYVPSYRNLATIYQLFNRKLNPKERVLLEDRVLTHLITESAGKKEKEETNLSNFQLKVFTEAFNKEYSGILLTEQKTLLEKYILFDVDNGAEFKMCVNEELERIKDYLGSAIETKLGVLKEETVREQVKNVVKLLNEFKELERIDENALSVLLGAQKLVAELTQEQK